MRRKLLLVEDDIHMREIVADYFIAENWDVIEAENGLIALEKFEEYTIDLIILDIMMPKLDGFGVCRSIRRNSDVPIIMITAKSEDDDQVLGYELGADEYVTKPFSPRVLVARANALLKRTEGTVGSEGEILIFGELTVHRNSHEVKLKNEIVNLSPKEYELLLLLTKHSGKVLSRDYILNTVWGYHYEGDDRAVDTHIKKLRAKLGAEGRFIVTVIRSGYKFDPQL